MNETNKKWKKEQKDGEKRGRERKIEEMKEGRENENLRKKNKASRLTTCWSVIPPKPFLLEEQCKVHMLCMSLPNNYSMGVGGMVPTKR